MQSRRQRRSRGRPRQPVHSFRSLLADLATVTRNVMAMDGAPEANFVLYPQLTPVQDRAFQLLDIAQKVLDKNADYILALKGNQGTLREDVELFAAEQRA